MDQLTKILLILCYQTLIIGSMLSSLSLLGIVLYSYLYLFLLLFGTFLIIFPIYMLHYKIYKRIYGEN